MVFVKPIERNNHPRWRWQYDRNDNYKPMDTEKTAFGFFIFLPLMVGAVSCYIYLLIIMKRTQNQLEKWLLITLWDFGLANKCWRIARKKNGKQNDCNSKDRSKNVLSVYPLNGIINAIWLFNIYHFIASYHAHYVRHIYEM